METLRRKVRRVRRRLALQQMLDRLVWCWFGALLASAVWLAVDKFYPLGLATDVVIVAALALGLVAAVGWVSLRSPSLLEAALAIDQRFDLRERISSAFSIGPALQIAPAGQALLADTLRQVEDLELSARFGVRLRRWWLPLPSALAVLLVVFFLHPVAGSRTAQATEQTLEEQKRVENTTKVLSKRLQEQRRKALEEQLPEVRDLFEKLEQSTEEISQTQKLDRKQALAQLNNLADDVKERQKRLHGAQQMKDQLRQLQSIPQGPADRLADALRKGEFHKAAETLQKLQEQIRDGQLNKDDLEALKKQLEQLQQQLEKLADVQQRREELQRRREELQKRGLPTDDIDRQLQELEQQAQHLEQLAQLADKLGEAQQALEAGQMAEALEQLELAETNLEGLAQALEELSLLEQTMAALGEARNAMNCDACLGMGCAQCQALGLMEGMKWGMGLGAGRGVGPRPEQADETASYDTQTRPKLNPGQAIAVGRVSGPSVKGQTQIGLQEALESAGAAPPDALNRQKLPRGYKEHAKSYFDRIREGR